ncbi:MAG: alpha/beta fold hydrolase [Silvanigrellaceae bacterium]
MNSSWATLPLPNGSLSTMIAARLSAKHVLPMMSTPFKVSLGDGSILTGEIDCLSNSNPKANIILVHGLGSSCHDPSIVRQARFLAQRNFKVFRLNHRNIGSGKGKALGFYHGFRGPDIKEALADLHKREPGARWILVGHSMSGNMVLKIAGVKEHADELKSMGCVGVSAISPVVDLRRSSRSMHKPMFGLFNTLFLKKINAYIRRLDNVDESLKTAARGAKKLFEFDELFLAPALGLPGAQAYYDLASSKDVLDEIQIQTEIFLAKDDPIAPGTYKILQQTKNPNLRIHASRFGGHLGFLRFDFKARKFNFFIDELLGKTCDQMIANVPVPGEIPPQ